MATDIIFELFLAFALGALIWIERGIYENETEKEKKPFDAFWWVRTFWLISTLWALLWAIAVEFEIFSLLSIWILIVSFFILSFYTLSWLKSLKFSLTSEISAIITFFLWVMISVWYYQIAIVISILLTLLLSSEGYIDKFIDKISRQEFNNTIKFAVIALVVLPILPNEVFSISDFIYLLGYDWNITNNILNLPFFNPYSLWLFVVLMSGISYIWYIMSKFIGEKSSILASWAIWWMASSTALTASMSELSKNDVKNRNLYVVATLIASIIMFIRVIWIVVVFNINLLSSIIVPSILMLCWLVLYIVFFYVRSQRNQENASNVKSSEKFQSPFRIWPALKFATVVLMTKFVAWLWTLYADIWWDTFFYALWIISGWADADALAQTMAVTAKDWTVWITVAAIAIILWVMSNNLVKWFMAMKFWEKKFWWAVMIWFLVSMIMWIFGIIFLNI